MCVFLVFSSLTAGLNEFEKRAQFITESRHALVLEPLMKRCLDEHPVARGTFEDVKKDLSDYQSKYGRKQTHELEEQIVRHSRECECACEYIYVIICDDLLPPRIVVHLA